MLYIEQPPTPGSDRLGESGLRNWRSLRGSADSTFLKNSQLLVTSSSFLRPRRGLTYLCG